MKNTVKLIDIVNSSASDLFTRGIKLIGPASGAYLGIITKDPHSIVLGAVIGEVIAQNVNDFSNRFLSEKEKNNISIAEIFSIAKILENQDNGEILNEKLFNSNISGNAHELYNGILVSAKNNYEDKKLEILGRFFGNSVFQDDLEPYLIHFLLSTLTNLNFKQICILSLVGQHEIYFKSLQEIDELYKKPKWYELYLIQNELSNLILTGLLDPFNDALLRQTNKRHINKTRLSTVGEMIFNLCDLGNIDEEDLSDIVSLFK